MLHYDTASELLRAVEAGEEEVVGLRVGVKPSESEVAAIARAVGESGKVKMLVLRGNKITDVGASVLAEAVARSASLTSLYLDNNQITDVGASALAEAVARSTTSLTVLFLYNNQITDVGALSLAKALARSSKLTTLNIVRNRHTDLGNQALDAAYATIKATRPTLWLLTGAPSSATSPATIWRRFILIKDGDHAIWSRVMDFLAGAHPKTFSRKQ